MNSEFYWLVHLKCCCNTIDQGFENRKARARHRVLCWICWWVKPLMVEILPFVFIYFNFILLSHVACAFSLKWWVYHNYCRNSMIVVVTSYGLVKCNFLFQGELTSLPELLVLCHGVYLLTTTEGNPASWWASSQCMEHLATLWDHIKYLVLYWQMG